MSFKISCIKRDFIYEEKFGFICKEKYGAVTKVKLVTKIKKLRKSSFILELWYYHHIVIVEITHKMQTSFKTLASKKAATWHLKKNLRLTLIFHEK